MKREKRRLDRIHENRIRKEAERIRECAEHDACDKTDCVYHLRPEEALELANWVLDLLDDEEEADKCENACVFENQGV